MVCKAGYNDATPRPRASLIMLRISLAGLALVLVAAPALPAQQPLAAGFAAVEITPDLKGEKPVYMAGYGMNRRAKGVHDPLYARTVVLASGEDKIAIVSVDLVGLQYPEVRAIRAQLPQIKYVLVSSTHNHEGPDVIGIWGRGPFHRGVNEAYLDFVVERVVASVKQAADKLLTVTATYGTAADETLLNDSRLPIVKDGVLRIIKLAKAGGSDAAGLLVQWNCHPESLGSRNLELTADFPWATVAALEKQYRCPVVYLSGAVGGLMGLPRGRVFDAQGQELKFGTFEYAQKYGEEVAVLAAKAESAAQPIGLTPFVVSAKPITVPVQNSLYRAARAVGVLKRDGFVWTGDFQRKGEPITAENADLPSAIESEVAYVRLGELHIACIPGELYPELVYGKFQEPVEPDADFPDAPKEPVVAELMPGPKWLLLGLANDELGYIIPKRQWDKTPPYAYNKDGGQYGEVNSCGSEIAPIIMQALKLRIAAAKP